MSKGGGGGGGGHTSHGARTGLTKCEKAISRGSILFDSYGFPLYVG